RLGARPVPIQIPVGLEKEFRGVIDLVRMRYYEFDDDSEGRKYKDLDVPASMQDEAHKWRRKMLEFAAENDEELLDLFVEDQEPPVDLVMRALRAGTIRMDIFPVVCGSALKHKGVRFVLDSVIDFLPSPLDIPAIEGTLPRKPDVKVLRSADDDQPLAALAFKTISEPTGDLTFVRV